MPRRLLSLPAGSVGRLGAAGVTLLLAAPLAMLAGLVVAEGWTTTLTVEVVVGRDVGLVQVWLAHPGGYAYAFAEPEGGRIVVEFSIDYGLAERVVSEGAAGASGGVEVAQVFVAAYSYTGDGRVCVRAGSYSTADYYLEKTGSPVEAARLADEDPLALLRLERLTLALPEGCAGLELTPAKPAAGVVEAGPSAPEPAPPKQAGAGHGGVSAYRVEPRMPTSPPCPLAMVDVAFPSLEGAATPGLWLERVIVDPSLYPGEDERARVIGELWDAFTGVFSLSYYFHAGLCVSPDEAVLAASYYTRLPPGVHSMDHVVYTLAEMTGYTGAVLGWADERGYGSTIRVYDAAPLALVTRYTRLGEGASYPLLDLSIVKFQGVSETLGITLGGVVVLGFSRTYHSLYSEDVALDAGTYRYAVGFIYAPLKVKYYFDALVVNYRVELASVGGEQYWRVTPLFYFTPAYTLEYDLNSLDAAVGSYYDRTGLLGALHDAARELATPADCPLEGPPDQVYSCLSEYFSDVTVYRGVVEPGPAEITVDSSLDVEAWGYNLGWLVAPAASHGAARVLASISSTFRLLSTLAAAAVGVSISEAGISAFEVRLDIVRVSSMEPVWVEVVKRGPLQGVLASPYTSVGEAPVVLRYSVVIGG